MSEQTPPLNPFWFRPLTSDPDRAKRLAKKVQAMAPKPKEAPKPLTEEERRERLGLCCPQCGCSATDVIETRASLFRKVRRRRECVHCGHRFTTLESVAGKKQNTTGSARPKKSE